MSVVRSMPDAVQSDTAAGDVSRLETGRLLRERRDSRVWAFGVLFTLRLRPPRSPQQPRLACPLPPPLLCSALLCPQRPPTLEPEHCRAVVSTARLHRARTSHSTSHGGFACLSAGTHRHLFSAGHFQVQAHIVQNQESALKVQNCLAAGASIRPRPGLCWIRLEAHHSQPRQRPVLLVSLPARWLGRERRPCIRTPYTLSQLRLRCRHMHPSAKRRPRQERR